MEKARCGLRKGWRTATFGGSLVLLAGQAFAAPLPVGFGLGAKVIATGGAVTVRILPTDPLFTSDVFVETGCATVCGRRLLGSNFDSVEVSLGTFDKAEEIVLGIEVRDTQHVFRTGPASRNPIDDLAHAVVTQKDPTTVTVSFEDVLGGGDRDFNDVTFEVEGAVRSVVFSGLPVTSQGNTGLDVDSTGALTITPIRLGEDAGLTVPLGDSSGWDATFLASDLAASGTKLATSLRGTLDGIAGQPVVESRVEGLGGGQIRFSVDLTALGAQSLEVTFFDSEGQVLHTAHPSGLPPLEWICSVPIPGGEPTPAELRAYYFSGFFGVVTINEFRCPDLHLQELSFSDVAVVSIRALEIEPQVGSLSEATVTAAKLESLRLLEQGFPSGAEGKPHRSLGQATLVAQEGTLTVEELDPFSSFGVTIDLGNVEAFDLAWSEFLFVGLTLTGSSLELGARGTIQGAPNRDLGTLRLTQVNGKVEITADYSAVGSPTQRILVFNRGQLVADVPGHTGVVARMAAWPRGAGKGNTILGPLQLPCYTLPLPEDTCIAIPGGPTVFGDQLVVLSENPDAGLESLSELSLLATRLPPITFLEETVSPLR